MILALRTGWTPEVIGGAEGVADTFRRAAHFALYAEALEDIRASHRDILAIDERGATPRDKARVVNAKVRAQRALTEVTEQLYPADD